MIKMIQTDVWEQIDEMRAKLRHDMGRLLALGCWIVIITCMVLVLTANWK